MARPTGPSDATSVGAPSDGVGVRAAQASGRRQHPTAVARQSTLDHRPIGPPKNILSHTRRTMPFLFRTLEIDR